MNYNTFVLHGRTNIGHIIMWMMGRYMSILIAGIIIWMYGSNRLLTIDFFIAFTVTLMMYLVLQAKVGHLKIKQRLRNIKRVKKIENIAFSLEYHDGDKVFSDVDIICLYYGRYYSRLLRYLSKDFKNRYAVEKGYDFLYPWNDLNMELEWKHAQELSQEYDLETMLILCKEFRVPIQDLKNSNDHSVEEIDIIV